MPITLPTQKVAPTRTAPKIIILYGDPKIGKTKVLSTLDECLTLDTEGGTDMYDMLKLKITSAAQFYEVVDAIIQKAKENIAAGGKAGFPYKFIAVDTLDLLEDMCEVLATQRYKASTIGKNFEDTSVLELPQGAGYYHLREAVKDVIGKLDSVCKHLILIAHIKEKEIDKGGVAVTSKDISLTGKLGKIMAAKADAVGYLYRDGAKMMVSFETGSSESLTMGSRFGYLAGKRFEFSWDKIFPEAKLIA